MRPLKEADSNGRYFDVNPVLKGISVRGIEIRMADELPEFIKEHHVEIAALTLPKAKA